MIIKGGRCVKKLVVIYWSGTGNTERMAEAIAEGAKEIADVKVLFVDKATKEDVINADAVALGCPSMGNEVLEEGDMEPFVEFLSDVDWEAKPLALFGSYDWGDGEWMRDWESRMRDYGANLVQEGLIAQLDPSGEVLEKCKDLGKQLVG